MSKGRTLKLYLVDGSPSGLITAEIMNWSGHVITAPRARLPDLLKRPETQRTGVYFLVGPEQAVPDVYIGETDDIGERLTQHDRPEGNGETYGQWQSRAVEAAAKHASGANN